MKDYVIKDKHGYHIHEGDKFTFSYKKSEDYVVKYTEEGGVRYKERDETTFTLTGSFSWNDDELRYEIDIDAYNCLSYDVINMSNFELLN